MGGSYERGWGALSGTVEIQVAESTGDRISAIKLTLTATQITTVPKTASAEAPSALDRMAIDPEETKTKEVTLLQVERILFEPVKTELDRDANLLLQGKRVYPFSLELPLVGNKDKKNPPLLPPSCVIEPLVLGPGDAKIRQGTSGLFGRSKSNGKDAARPSWATVKYQLKLTVQRPGLLKRNLRSYAPFVYLPPPASSATSLLLQRRALGAQMAAIVLQRQGDGCQPVETPTEWRQRPLTFLMSPNGPQMAEPEKKTGFLSSLFGGPKKQPVAPQWHEAWSLSMPMTGRSSFPLRSAIPFIVRCTTNKPIDLSAGSPLAFRLYRRVRLLSGKKQKAVAMQQEPVAEAALRYAVESRGVFRLNGVISLPPNCVPNFDTPHLSLDYYVAVVRIRDGVVVHKESVTLACPPPVEPKTPYGPFPSGLAWRQMQDETLSPPHTPSPRNESPPMTPRSMAAASAFSTGAPARQRPSISSMASSSSSSFQTPSRRPSAAPSARSYLSASTDSAHYVSAASSMTHGSTGASAAAASMGLAGMSNPPPASSAGASGLGLDPVREQSRATSSGNIKLPASPRQQSTRRGSQNDGLNASTEAADTASISSSRRRERYSAKGAAPISEASSARSSADYNRREEARLHTHVHEKSALAAMGQQDSQASTRAASSDVYSGRRGLFVTNAEDLPSIPTKAAASTREYANALVGAVSKTATSRDERSEDGRRASASRSRSNIPIPQSSNRSGRDATGASAHRTRRTERPLPQAPATPIQTPAPITAPASAPAPAPIAPQPTAVDPAFLLTNEDLMYGEDMELDLPPSYFEAVHGAEEDDD